jgi:PHP family Zn ribbon phosphoesterase
MRLFGGDRIKMMMDKMSAEEDMDITSGMVSKAIERAQRKVEVYHFNIRKQVLEYDDVMNNQRKIVYAVHTNQSGKIMRAKGGSGGGGAIQVKHVDGNMKKERRALKRIAKKKGGKGASGARKTA